MRIAYVSFEYPPDTAVGGIATYVYQVSKMMQGRGHDVEVFCASPVRSGSETYEGVQVHRIHTDDRLAFPELVVPVFAQRHQAQPFEVLESPEFLGDGAPIKRRFPALPLVVKLHTPARFIQELDAHYAPVPSGISAYQKFRFMLGGLLRGQRRKPYWQHRGWQQDPADVDYQVTSLADQIHTPSISLGNIVAEKWAIERRRILDVPYPFIPTPAFLRIPIVPTETQSVTFLGRLEIRKGLVALVEAIPAICQAVPAASFQFVGKAVQSPEPGLDMRQYIETKLAAFIDRLTFRQLAPADIPALLAQTDVCVFPSIWENFPNVCLEAMSAGRAIVGSREGGMRDMLESPEAGVLINPLDPPEIARAVIQLLQEPLTRVRLGEAARRKVLTAYTSEKIGELMEWHYAALRSQTK